MRVIEIPREALQTAADDVAGREKEVAAENARLSGTLSELRVECKRETRAAIDPAVLVGYERVHASVKQRLAVLATEMRPTTTSMERAERMRRQLLGEAKQATTQMGIDVARIEEIRRKYASMARSVVESTFASGDEAPYVQINPKQTPTRLHNRWDWRSAPYANQWGTWWSYGSRGGRAVTSAQNRLTGEIGCWSGMNIYGADDCDYSYTSALSEQHFWFSPPAAGMVEVWVYLQVIDTPFSGCLSDEWGVCDASIQELSRPYLQVISPYGPRRYGTLLDYRRGEVDGCWAGAVATPGEYRYAHLFSLGSFAAGQPLLCSVGIHDYSYMWVNDMSCRTNMTSRWFVKDIAVRSTGAP